MFISSACFQKYERFVDKSAKVLMAETVALTPDRMFVEIIYKSLFMETATLVQLSPEESVIWFVDESNTNA